MIQRGSSPRIVGRAEELEVLRGAFGRLADGDPAAVLVGGDAGIGKSRLVGALAEEVEGTGARVLWGSCVADGGPSYAPMSQALRSLLRGMSDPQRDELIGESRELVARLLPELGSPTAAIADPVGEDAATGQHRLFVQVLGLLAKVAHEQPLLLVQEDLHWADASTRALLGFLSRNLAGTPTMLVGTYRTEHLRRGDPLRQLLLDLDHSGLAERMELEPLDDAEVADLLTGVLGVPPAPSVAQDIARRAQGNPLFSEELLAARRAGHERLPPTLRDLLIHRVDDLDIPGRTVVDVAAVLGDRFDHRLLAAVADVDADELHTGVREAIDSQLLLAEPSGHAYAFRHRLILEAIYDAVPPGDRLRWHTAAAEALDHDPALATDPVAARAHHWDAAGRPARALPAHVAAGERAESMYGFAEAHHHFARAAELWESADHPEPSAPLDRVDLLERAARAANRVGEHDAAIGLLSRALDATDVTDDIQGLRAPSLRQQLGESRLRAGDLETGVQQILQGLADLPDGAPPGLRAGLLATAGLTQALLHPDDDAVLWCEEAIALATDADAPAVEARARSGLGLASLRRGDGEGALAQLRRARTAATRAADPEEQLRACVNTQAALAHLGRLEESLAVGEEGLALVDRLGRDRRQDAMLRCNQAEVRFALGRWDEVLATLRPVRTAQGYAAGYAHELRAALAIAEGRLEDAEESLSAIPQVAPDSTMGRAGAAELALARDDPAAAAEAVHGALDVRSMGDSHQVSAQLRWLGVRASADLVEAAAARRRLDAANAHLEAAQTLHGMTDAGAASSLPPMRAYAALIEAELTRALRTPDPPVWEEAVARWEEIHHPYRAAYARWRQAEALALTHGDAGTIMRVLRDAHSTTIELGAAPLRKAVERLAARTGIALDPAEHPDPALPPDPLAELGLTSREREVLRLLGAGRTNQQISDQLVIARKTASVHVSNILRKLAVSNRAEAAAVAHRLGAVDEPESEASRR